MAEQYFTENPTVDHDEHHVNYHLNGINLNLTTDAGVFFPKPGSTTAAGS